MKTVQLDDQIKRVEDDLADRLINEGWNYVPKEIWKELHNSKPEPNPTKQVLGTKIKKNKLTRKDKRQLKNEKKSN